MVFQNQNLQKTFFIGAGIICALLQVGIAPHLAILNGHPNFALIFAGCAMATLPPLPSVLCGFFAGVFFDLVGAGPFGLMAFCLSLMNFLCSLNPAKRMGESWREAFRLFCISAVCVEFTALLGEAIAGDVLSLSAVLTAFLPAVFWDCICALPFFFVMGRLTPTASSAEGSVGASKYADKSYTLGGSGTQAHRGKGVLAQPVVRAGKGVGKSGGMRFKKGFSEGFMTGAKKGLKKSTLKSSVKGPKKGA